MRSEVILLATVHRLHHYLPFYTPEHLRRALAHFDPDVLCAEVPPLRYLSHIDLRRKPELKEVILPFTRARHIPLHSLAPGDPERKAMAHEQMICAGGMAGEWGSSFERYCLSGRYFPLISSWRSIPDLYSARTGAFIRKCLVQQEGRYREIQTMAWVDWNIYYLGRILEAIEIYPHRRILAAVGVDHLHWLEGKLSGLAGVHLLDAAALLQGRSFEEPGESGLPEATRTGMVKEAIPHS